MTKVTRREAIKTIVVTAGVMATVSLSAEEDPLTEIDQFQWVFKPDFISYNKLNPHADHACFGRNATLGWKGYIHKPGCGQETTHSSTHEPSGKTMSYRCRSCHCDCQYGDFIMLPDGQWTKEQAIARFGDQLKKQAREVVRDVHDQRSTR